MGIKLIKKTNEAAYTAVKNPKQAAFIIDCGSPEKAKELNDAFSVLAEKVLDRDDKEAGDAIGRNVIMFYDVGPFFTACVDPCDKAAAWCEEWLRNSGSAAPAIQGNSAGLESKASEDRRGTDRYGHHVKRFTTKDLKGLDGDGDGDNGGNGADAGADDKFGLAYMDTTSISAFSNNFSTSERDNFLHDLAQMPVSKKSIEDLLRKHPLHKYGRAVGVRDFFPDNGIAYLGTYGDDGLPYKSICLKWGPALKK